MAIITPVPLYFDDVVLTIDGNDYAPAASQASLEPNTTSTVFHGLKPDDNFPASSTDWSLTLAFVQDWDSTASLARYLFANQGSTIATTLKPRSGSGPSFTMNLHIVPGSIGGTTRSHATTTVTLPLKGIPTLVEA